MPENRSNVKKTKGRVYTPGYLVKSILDLAHYNGANILGKHVMENSCGDGAFLCEIVDRYCANALKNHIALDDLAIQLETYIHGIEIDPIEHEKCLKNMHLITKKYGIISDIKWDVICADTLKVDKYNGKMDFVLGNPPYIRVHNLNDSFDMAKEYSFAQKGMTDLYIVFYEIGINMLNKNGVLGYITPSSFFNSLAGKYLRKYLVQENLIEKLVDLKHYQAFQATTYTAITILNKQHYSSELEYYQFDDKNLIPYYIETLTPDDYYIAKNFYFSTKNNLALLKRVFSSVGHCDVEVKNGYATLCDDVFIGSFGFESKYVIPVIKASRGEVKQIIYPYNSTGKLISIEELEKDQQVYEYLLSKKDALLKRSFEDMSSTNWYAFGRSQALNDTYKDKICINTILRSSADLKIIPAPAGTGVYSGLYIIGREVDFSKVSAALLDDEFAVYISLLGKYKSGGYYTFSSKDLKAYLDYKLEYNGGLLE